MCVALHVQQTLEPLFTVSRQKNGESEVDCKSADAVINHILGCTADTFLVDTRARSLSLTFEKRLQGLLHV